MVAIHYDFYSNQAALFMEILAPLLPEGGGNADILKNWETGVYTHVSFDTTREKLPFN
jgi:hypothetical protein